MVWTWRDEIVEVLSQLGGVAPLSDICRLIEKRGRKPLIEHSVRQCIEDHSSDSQSWRKKPVDLFYSVDGLGGGVWGLRQGPEASIPDAPDTAPSKVETTVYRVLRDTALARNLKRLHANRCQICNTRVLINGAWYSEAHHLHPLGLDGPDVAANIIVLCPNHHVSFDFGSIAVDPMTFQLVSIGKHDPKEGAKIRLHPSHPLGAQYLDYHLKTRYKRQPT